MDMEKLEYQCSIIPEITTITPTTEIFTVKILKPEADSENGASTTTEKEFLTDELKTGIIVNIFFVKFKLCFACAIKASCIFGWNFYRDS
jgi:hypothetical protein